MRWAAAMVAGAALVAVSASAGCGERTDVVPKASAKRGHDLIVENGCGMCHTIGGVELARGNVGPPLTNFRRKRLIAGKLPNRPDSVVRWLLNPQAVDPGTLMPNLRLTPEQARDIADYLYGQ